MLKGLRAVVAGMIIWGMAASDVAAQETYGGKVAYKLGVGFANIVTSWLEVPKCMINGYNNADVVFGNEADFVYGVTTGVIKGVINTVGRTFTGTLDVITFPLPTKPIPNPPLIWKDFAADTHYGKAFQVY